MTAAGDERMRIVLFGATGMVGQGVLPLGTFAFRPGYVQPVLENADLTALARRDRPAGS